jgi:hypothetical protein
LTVSWRETVSSLPNIDRSIGSSSVFSIVKIDRGGRSGEAAVGGDRGTVAPRASLMSAEDERRINSGSDTLIVSMDEENGYGTEVDDPDDDGPHTQTDGTEAQDE